jgi:probable rRNA maturation factor
LSLSDNTMPKQRKKKSHKIVIQRATSHSNIPSRYYFQRWIDLVLDSEKKKGEITIRIVDEKESKQLNHRYRHKNKPTNVLSFPFEDSQYFKLSALGDLVICAPVIEKEAYQQNKNMLAHWAHMVIHGTLHLLGYDHVKENEAEIMEKKEILLLERIGFENPYH